MKNLKKILAVALAVMMLAALSVTALASGTADMNGEAGVIGEFTNPDTPVPQAKSVKLYKELTVFNPENSTVNAPTITYTYTVTPGSANKDIYDVKTAHTPNANAHVLTKAGITIGLTVNSGTVGTDTNASGTVSWSPTADTLTATDSGTKNTKDIVLDFSNVNFTGAGVYRYTITESATNYGSSGVVDGTISNVRYLDVYVKDGSTAGTYDIYGYTCFINDNNIDAQDTPTASTPNTVTEAAKTEGFVATSAGGTDGATAQTADQYYTYNVTIGKTLVGDQAMNSHQFPFKVVFANETVTDPVLPIATATGTATAPNGFTAANINAIYFDGTTPSSDADQAKKMIKIANGGTVTFTGIPAGTMLTIDEYNDVAGTTYKTTTSGGTTNESAGKNIAWNTWASNATGWTTVTAIEETANTNSAASDNVSVTFTNTLLTISPTGVAVRVAPFVLILAAGMMLLVLSRKSRKAED